MPLSVLALFLATTLILLDLTPFLTEKEAKAYTPIQNEGEMLLSFLGLKESAEPLTVTAQIGEVVTLPDLSFLPATLKALEDSLAGAVKIYPAYNLDPSVSNPLLYLPSNGLPYGFSSQATPPPGSPLYYAYRQGGSLLYGEGDEVVLIMPDKSTKSFFKSTGFESTFLQETLAYPPIAFPGAIDKYIAEYGGIIVAQTESWVLMKFPSGGFLKVAK